MLLAQILLPIEPATYKLAVVELFPNEDIAHGQQQSRFTSGPWRKPVICFGGCVGEAGVDDADLRAVGFAFHDSLGVRVEIMSSFEVRTEKKDEARVGVIRRRAVQPVPKCVTRSRPGRTHVGVTVVAVDTPGMQDALVINDFMPGTSDVIHDFVLASVFKRVAYTRRQ